MENEMEGWGVASICWGLRRQRIFLHLQCFDEWTDWTIPVCSIPCDLWLDMPRGTANAKIWPSDNCHHLRYRSSVPEGIEKSSRGVVRCGDVALGILDLETGHWRLETLYWSHSCSQAIYFIRPKRPDWTKSTLFSDFVHAGPGLALQFKIEDFFNFIYLHWHWLTDSHVFQVRQSDLQCISASMARQDCRPQCVQGSLMDRITPNARSCPQASDLVLEIMGHEFRSWHHMCTMTLYHYSNYMWTMWVPVLLVQHFTVMLFFILFAKGRTWTNQRWCKIRNGQPAWRGDPGKSIWVFNRQSDRVLVWQLQRLQGFWHFGWVIDSKSQLSCQGQCLTVLT